VSPDRAGEGALLVPEELALDELLADRRAVHRDERTLGAGAAGVDGARDQLLAGAGFAENGDRGGRGRDPLDEIDQQLHRRIGSNQALPGGGSVLAGRGRGLDHHVGLADVDLGVQRHLRLEQPDRAEPGAIGARVVQHQEAASPAGDAQVLAGDEPVVQHQVVPGVLADRRSLADEAMHGLGPRMAEPDLRRLPAVGARFPAREGLGSPDLGLGRLVAGRRMSAEDGSPLPEGDLRPVGERGPGCPHASDHRALARRSSTAASPRRGPPLPAACSPLDPG
jgi:hypothetical protein